MAQPPPVPPPSPLFEAQPSRNRWKLRCGILTSLYGAALVVHAWAALSLVPRHKRIFEDMLGSMSKLPTLSRAVIAMARTEQDYAIFILPLVLAIPLALWWSRGALWASLCCTAATLAFGAYAATAVVAMKLPLAQIIRSIGEGS